MSAVAVRPSRNPGAASRAAAELMADPARSDRLAASAAQCDPHTIRRVRRELEATGTIPAGTQRAQRTPPPRPPGRTRAAIAQGASTPSQVANAAGVSRQAAHAALKRQQRPAALADVAAATDALSVSRRKPKITSPDPLHRAPAIPDLSRPPPPDWSRGICVNVPPDMQGWWTSDSPPQRRAARLACGGCEILAQCQAWCLCLPSNDPAIYGGLSQVERLRRKRAQRAAPAGA